MRRIRNRVACSPGGHIALERLTGASGAVLLEHALERAT